MWYENMAGPVELANLVNEAWQEVPGLPTKDTIREIIIESYRLSLQVNEGRSPRLLLAAVGIDQLPEPSVRLGERPRFIRDIVAVAPALAPPPFALALSAGDVPRCRSIINLKKARNIPGIYFGIRGPGEIEVETYMDNFRRSWILSRGVCLAVEDITKGRLFVELCHAGARNSGCDEESIRKFLSRLIFTISRRGHGGALLFADSDSSIATSPSEIDFGNKPFPLLPSCIDSTELTKIISCLTQIDGAILLNFDFQVRRAGVFLDQKHTQAWQFTAHGPGTEIDWRNLGSRHRSSAWFCNQNEGARAIVISKDQVIRVFGNKDSRVLVEGPYIDSMISIARSGDRLSF